MFIEGEDYYINEEGKLVFTEKYHLKRGYCCQNGCLHCPYDFKKIDDGAKDEGTNPSTIPNQ